MSIHRFAVGQQVDFLPGPQDGNVPRGNYQVQRRMPSERGEPQYRVKYIADGHERVIAESQLALPAWSSAGSWPSARPGG